jgi:outer membrane immunogenic protein
MCKLREIGGLATTSQTTTAGGRGGFGTVQVGCDYQLSGDWVIGAFADWDFGSLGGKPELSNERWFGTEKQNWSWAVGGRVGYLVPPRLLAYVSGGYTQAHHQGFELFFTDDGDLGYDDFACCDCRGELRSKSQIRGSSAASAN